MIKIQVNRPIGYRIVEMGSGDRHKVRTDKAWNDHIKRLYDQNLNMTLKELSQITGLSVAKLKTILMRG